MLDTMKQKFKGIVRWLIAPPEAQSFNGLCEANVKQLKKLLLSHLKLLNLENYIFPSIITMQQSFTKVMGILNERPIYYTLDQIITAKDLMFPRFIQEEEKSKNTALEGLLENVDKAFQLFVNLH